MRVLVTGGAGFIGSHICDRLLADGHEVAVVDDLTSGVRNRCQGALYLYSADPVEPKGCEQCTPDDLAAFDAVVHAAAYPELRHNWDSPAERLRLRQSNIDATLSLLEAMPHVPIVYLSTASVYGSSSWGHLMAEDEAGPETIESPYAATKFAGEALVAAYAYARGTPWYVLRLVNVVGARTHRGVIVDFVRMMRERGKIHAADDGKQTKPWVHVADVATAVAGLIYQIWSDIPGSSRLVPNGLYNVTSPELISWWDIVDEMGVDRASVTFESRPKGAIGDPHNLRVSGEKLAPYFRPRRPVRDGIRDALDSLGWLP